MSKGSKEALTVLIVTDVTHVKRVESVFAIKLHLNLPKYIVRSPNIFTHNFLKIQRKMLGGLTVCFGGVRHNFTSNTLSTLSTRVR